MSLPLDAYLASSDGEESIRKAYESLVGECMGGQGFDYRPSQGADRPKSPLGVTDEAYGISEFSDAATYGYLGEDWNKRVDSLKQGQSVRDEFSPEYLTALTGGVDPTDPRANAGGCMAEASNALGDDARNSEDVFRIIGEIGVDAAARTRADDRVLTAFGRWSNCMRDAGYSYDVPSQPPKDFPVTIDINNLDSIPPPTSLEIETALADQECKRDVDLFDTWVSVESEYQREGIGQNEAALAEYANAVKARINTAKSILERPSSRPRD